MTAQPDPKTIIRQYQKPLYWFIRRIVHTHQDTQDILQEVFLKWWKVHHRIQNHQAYLYRLAWHETLRFLRKKRWQQTLSRPFSQFEDWWLQHIQADPYIDFSEAFRQLIHYQLQLPPRQYAVFVLRYFQQKSYEEIAQILDISPSGARAHYTHAVKKLRTLLSQLPHLHT